MSARFSSFPFFYLNSSFAPTLVCVYHTEAAIPGHANLILCTGNLKSVVCFIPPLHGSYDTHILPLLISRVVQRELAALAGAVAGKSADVILADLEALANEDAGARYVATHINHALGADVVPLPAPAPLAPAVPLVDTA